MKSSKVLLALICTLIFLPHLAQAQPELLRESRLTSTEGFDLGKVTFSIGRDSTRNERDVVIVDVEFNASETSPTTAVPFLIGQFHVWYSIDTPSLVYSN
jgi:hypothetical protein